ncbi:MAG: hypothetical protein ABH885_02095 [Candidatus Omnitrophota bacterium]
MMVFLVKVLGIFVAGFGISMMFDPGVFDKAVSYCLGKGRVRWSGVGKIVGGLVFISAAPHCAQKGFIALLGLLGVIGGVLMMIFGIGKAETILKWWSQRPPVTKKLVACIYFIAGTLIVFSV